MAEAAAMRVEVVSPERMLFSGDANQVITRTLGGGEIAFLAGHAPFLGALDACHTRIYLADGKVVDVAIHGGFVEVSNNKVSLLTDLAELGTESTVSGTGAVTAANFGTTPSRSHHHDAGERHGHASQARDPPHLPVDELGPSSGSSSDSESAGDKPPDPGLL